MDYESKELVFGNKVNSDGFVVETVVVNKDEIPTDVVIVPILEGIYRKPKWVDTEWVEGETEAERMEREAEQQLESFLPTAGEIADAELEIKMITLLNELEVIV